MIVHLTEIHAEEVVSKLEILAETPDLLEDYNLTEDQVRELIATVPTNGEWSIGPMVEAAVRGEMVDHVKVMRDCAAGARRHRADGQARATEALADALERLFQ